MNKLTNNRVKDDLVKAFPEFKDSQEYKEIFVEDGPYTYLSYFGNFLTKEINQSGDNEVVRRAFGFINDTYAREDLSAEVWDMLGIELLERLETEAGYKILANQYLKGLALVAFQKNEGRPEEK